MPMYLSFNDVVGSSYYASPSECTAEVINLWNCTSYPPNAFVAWTGTIIYYFLISCFADRAS
jgi:hypothetical protein